MSERVATADSTATDQGEEAQSEQAELAGTDLLVEEVSIDGMCGVY